MISTHVKQPGETLAVQPRFATRVPLFELVDVAIEAKGFVPGAEDLTFESQLANGVITLLLAGGSDGERYIVNVRAEDTSQAVLESEVEVAVMEASWQLPDGGDGYVTLTDFVNRYGLDEVVRMTDADGSGRIDRELLINALADAQAEADGHLADRYAVPLSTVPRLVAMAIADKARARLYPNGAPNGVADQAKAATRTLERIQSGQLRLDIPVAAAPAAESANQILIAPGRRAYPDGLEGY